MNFGLEESTLTKIQQVFEKYPQVDKVLLFGSRAKGNYRPDSDIDLALKGEDIALNDIISISRDLEENGIKLSIDLIDYDNIKEPALIEHIDRIGIELYSRWKKFKLKDVAEIFTGFSFKSEEYEPVGNLKVVRGENVTIGTLRWDTEKHWNKPTENLKKYFLNEDDIVIGMDGSRVGQNRAIIRQKELPLILAQRVARLRAKEGFNQKYLWYNIFSKQFQEYVESIHTGTSIPHISQSQIGDFEILCPPNDEQGTIASVLCSLDDKIDLLHLQNANLEQLAKTLFRQWFINEDEEIWEETTLDEHTEVFRGLSYKGSGLTEKGAGLPMHNLNSIYEGGGYKLEGVKFYKGEFKERHLVNTGDIIVANTEQGHDYKLIGFPAIVPNYYGDKGLFSQHIYKVLPLKSTFLTREFLHYLLMSSTVREQIISATNGSTVNMLAIDGLQRPSFNLPPKEKVDNFTSIVKNYWIKKNVNHNQIRSLSKLRDTLLPKLMSGEVRVAI